MSKQIHRRILPGAQIDHEGRLQSTWLDTATPLGCRPEPRERWDNAARRRDDPTRTRPWAYFFDPLRQVAEIAATRDAATMEQVEDRIIDAVIVALEYATAPIRVAREADPEVLPFPKLVTEEVEAFDAQCVAHAEPTTEHEAAAERESEEALHALTLYIADRRRRLLRRGRRFPRPQGAPPLGIA